MVDYGNDDINRIVDAIRYKVDCYKGSEQIIKEWRKKMLNQDYIYTGQTYAELLQDLEQADYKRVFVEPAYSLEFELLKASIKTAYNVTYPINGEALKYGQEITIGGALITNTASEKAKERKEIKLDEALHLYASGVVVSCECDGNGITYDLRDNPLIDMSARIIIHGKWYTKQK